MREARPSGAPTWVRVLGLPVLVYLLIAVPVCLRQIDRMNPDAVAYIRRATYLADGNFSASVSGYWSPMISWSIAPLLKLGVDGVHAARYALLLWGVAFLVAFYCFLKRLGGLPDSWKAITLTTTAVVLPVFALRQITPDVILATCLFAYFSVVVGDRFGKDRRVALIAGLLGGVAYLAKAYAFPFVILHLPLTIALRALAERNGAPIGPTTRRALSSLALAGLGFALVALPWVAVLSVKYQKPTFSTTGRVAHSVVGPAGLKQPSATRLELVPDPYISANENPEAANYPSWSPFESNAYFVHQMKVVRTNAAGMWDAVKAFHVFKLPIAWIAVVLGLLVTVGVLRLEETARWKVIWCLGTIALYLSGFLFVFFVPRYILPVILPLTIALALVVIRQAHLWTFRPATASTSEAPALDAASWAANSAQVAQVLDYCTPTPRSPGKLFDPRVRAAVALTVAILLCTSVAWGARKDLAPMWNTQSNPWHRRIATELKERDLLGPVASSDRIKGLYVAFHAGQKFLNFPTTKNPTDADRQLRQYNPAVFLVWSKKGDKGDDETDDADSTGSPSNTASVAEAVVAHPGWKSVFSSGFKKEKVEVFVPVHSEGGAGTPATAGGEGDIRKEP